MTRPSVHFFISSLGGGGAEKICQIFANSLFNLGWDIKILTLSNDLNKITILNQNIKITSLNVSRARYSVPSLMRYCVFEKPKCLVCFDYETAMAAAVIKTLRIANFKLIFRNINTISEIKKVRNNTFQSIVYNKLLNQIISKSDYIINQCNEMKLDLIKEYPFAKKKSVIIYNPISHNVQVNKLNPKVDDLNYFLIVGRLENQKSIHLAIEAFSIFNKQNNNFKLIILGEGSLKEKLVKYSEEIGVLEQVVFLGFKKETANYFINAKATLLTSEYEGFPNVLLESISFGTPIISFKCPGGIDEIIINETNGIIVEQRSVVQFSHAMHYLIEKTWSKMNIIESSNKFHIENILPDFEKLLLKCYEKLD